MKRIIKRRILVEGMLRLRRALLLVEAVECDDIEEEPEDGDDEWRNGGEDIEMRVRVWLYMEEELSCLIVGNLTSVNFIL